MKKISIISKIYIIFLISVSVNSQSISIKGLDNRSNLNSLNLHLATSKLCKEFYIKNDLVKEWNNKSNYQLPNNQSSYGCHVCAESIRYPFMTQLENFVDRFVNDKRLFNNKSNAFKIKSIKEEIKLKYEKKYNEMLDSIDPENMVFYQYDLIQGYNMETRELSISMWNPDFKNKLPNSNFSSNPINIPLLKGHGITDNGNLVAISGNYIGWFVIPMNESDAEMIYSNYANYYNSNPPFIIGTNLHYAIKMGDELNGKPRNYQIVLKKVEFFLPKPENINLVKSKVHLDSYKPENKIAEVVFEEKLNHNKQGYTFQKIKSIK